MLEGEQAAKSLSLFSSRGSLSPLLEAPPMPQSRLRSQSRSRSRVARVGLAPLGPTTVLAIDSLAPRVLRAER